MNPNHNAIPIHSSFLGNGNNNGPNNARVLGTSVETSEGVPYFSRIDDADYNEIQMQRSTIAAMKERIKRLEHMTTDLENRLEDQGRQCMAAERECLTIKKDWSQRCHELKKEINKWKSECDAQSLKTEKMKEHLSRTERELYGILQKKYEFKRPLGPKDKGPLQSGAGSSGGGGGGGSGVSGASGVGGTVHMTTSSGLGSAGGGNGGLGGGLLLPQSGSRHNLLEETVDVTSNDNDFIESVTQQSRNRLVANLADFLGV